MTQEAVGMRASEDDGTNVRIFVSPIYKCTELGGYIWTEQGMLTSIDAHNQRSAVFVYFQSRFVF
jgi:hypothetical protein